jgi:hypothetical protein
MLIGTDSTGAACVKITKGGINPVTEPDANKSSFYYNSKVAADVKLAATDSQPFVNGRAYLPSGTNVNSYKKAYEKNSLNGTFIIAMRNTNFPDLPYSLPVFDIKTRRLSNDRYIEISRVRREGSDDNLGREPGYFETFDRGTSMWFENRPQTSADAGPWFGAVGNGILYYGDRYASTDANQFEKELIVWRLPGDNTPIENGNPKAPVAGQRSVEITKDFCRVAKPGYDVRTATPTQLAFDSSGRPLSAIGADDISLPPGVSSHNLGFPVTANMLADVFLYSGETLTFPMSRRGTSLECEYWFSGSSIFFNNTQSATVRCRFIVFANDREPLTSGNNKVFRQFTAGGQNVMQLLRPGAGNTPAFRDIMLDSRWPCIQILAEGYRTIASRSNVEPPSQNAGQSFEVNIDASGFFPVVKYMTVHQHPNFGKLVKFPQTLITEHYTGSPTYHQGNSSYCEIDGNVARFWTFRGNPQVERYTDSGGWGYDYPDDPIIGIRYYILGIPQ